MTEAQQRFCRLIAVEGMSATAAYMQVSGCKPNSAATIAARWLKKVEIAQEVERLSTAAKAAKERARERESRAKESARIWSKVERMEQLQRWAEEAAGEGRYADSIRAVAELNKMDGAYEPEKVQLGVQGTFAAVMEDVMGNGQ